MAEFPSLKARKLLSILKRKPLFYEREREKGSHQRLVSKSGYPPLTFSFHDNVEIPPGLVRTILVGRVGLSEEEALKLL